MYWVDRSTGEIVSERDKNKHLWAYYEYLRDYGNGVIMNALEEKTKEKTVKRKKNYYLVKSDVLGYAKRKGLINGRSKRQISERGTR